MDACHLLLGHPWQYDRQAIHDGLKNTYSFKKDGVKIVSAPLKRSLLGKSGPKATLCPSQCSLRH